MQPKAAFLKANNCGTRSVLAGSIIDGYGQPVKNLNAKQKK